MNLTTILRNKNKKKQDILNKYGLKDIKKSLWLILLKENLVDEELINALKILPANFVLVTEKKIDNLVNISILKNVIIDSWFDFIACDNCEENLMKFLESWVVPIVSKNHHISSLLSEFKAKTVEWNAFIFENDALCDIYYAIIRFVENYKFPYDHKALVKNVLQI